MNGAHADHSHSHHTHAPANFGRAFAVGVVLNSAFVAIEAVYGLLSGSMALVADAVHNLSDVLALLIAWGASIAARRPSNARYTYGYKSSTILASLANALLLAVAIGALLIESLDRLFDPVRPDGLTMIVVAGIGVVINSVTALMFMRGRASDLNIRGAYLHMAADALVSLGVVIAGIAIIGIGAVWIDPMTSLVILGVIGWGTWGLAKDSLKLALDAVPDGIDERAVRAFLAERDGVESVHHLHIWPLSTTETALTVHLVMPQGHPGDAFIAELARALEREFDIGHSTIQIETERKTEKTC